MRFCNIPHCKEPARFHGALLECMKVKDKETNKQAEAAEPAAPPPSLSPGRISIRCCPALVALQLHVSLTPQPPFFFKPFKIS